MGCELCHVRKQERDRVAYEDEQVFVLVNREALKDGHVIVLPVRHAEQLSDLTPEESQAYLRVIDRVMTAVTEAYGETAMCLVNGRQFRTQPHLHSHVLPSKTGTRGLYVAAEGLEFRKIAEAAAMKKVADDLRNILQGSK